MTICSPEAGNIARGQYYLLRVNKSSCYPHTRASVALLCQLIFFLCDVKKKNTDQHCLYFICSQTTASISVIVAFDNNK